MTHTADLRSVVEPNPRLDLRGRGGAALRGPLTPGGASRGAGAAANIEFVRPWLQKLARRQSHFGFVRTAGVVLFSPPRSWTSCKFTSRTHGMAGFRTSEIIS